MPAWALRDTGRHFSRSGIDRDDDTRIADGGVDRPAVGVEKRRVRARRAVARSRSHDRSRYRPLRVRRRRRRMKSRHRRHRYRPRAHRRWERPLCDERKIRAARRRGSSAGSGWREGRLVSSHDRTMAGRPRAGGVLIASVKRAETSGMVSIHDAGDDRHYTGAITSTRSGVPSDQKIVLPSKIKCCPHDGELFAAIGDEHRSTVPDHDPRRLQRKSGCFTQCSWRPVP